MMEIYLKKAIIDEDKDVIRDILNRIDGMPKQSIKLDGENLTTKIIFELVKKDGEKDTGNLGVPEEPIGIPGSEK